MHKQQTLGKILSSCLSAKYLTDKKDKLTDMGKLGKMLSCFPESVKSFSTGRFEFLKQWLLRKNCHCLGNLGIRLHRLSAEKEIGRNIKGHESSTTTISHLITSGPLASQGGLEQARERHRLVLERINSSHAALDEAQWSGSLECSQLGGLFPAPALTSSLTLSLSNYALSTCLVFLGKTTQNKINIMELKTLRLFRTYCPQFERKGYQGK